MLKILVLSKRSSAEDQPLFDMPGIDIRYQASAIEPGTRETAWRPDVLVFRQVRRNELTGDTFDAAIRQFPLAARVMLYGPWCEGETRSGRPQRGLHRVNETNWRQQLEQAIAQFRATGTTGWHRPVTGLRQQPVDQTGNSEADSVDIVGISQTHGFRETFTMFCDSRGWNLIDVQQAAHCDVVVIECCFSVTEAIELEPEIRGHLGVRPVVVVCGFPRRQDHELLAETFSQYQLIGKPFNNSDLHQAIISLSPACKLGVFNQVA